MNPNQQEPQVEPQASQPPLPHQQPDYQQNQLQQSNNQTQIPQVDGVLPHQSAQINTMTTLKSSRKKWAYTLLATSLVGISLLAALLIVNRSDDETSNHQSDTSNANSGPTNVVDGTVMRDGVEVVWLVNEHRAQYGSIVRDVATENLNYLLGVTGKANPDESYGDCSEEETGCVEGRGVFYESKNSDDARRIVREVVKNYLDKNWKGSEIIDSELKSIRSHNDIEFDSSTGLPKHRIVLSNYLTYEDEVIINKMINIGLLFHPQLEEDLLFGIEVNGYTWNPQARN